MTSEEKKRFEAIDREPVHACRLLLTHKPSPSKALRRFRVAFDADKEPFALERHSYALLTEYLGPDTPAA